MPMGAAADPGGRPIFFLDNLGQGQQLPTKNTKAGLPKAIPWCQTTTPHELEETSQSGQRTMRISTSLSPD